MAFNQKALRYYYWIMIEFVKKHLKLISLSFLISIVIIVGVISFSPYLLNFTATSKEIIGIVGNVQPESVPDNILSKVSSGLIFINDKGQIMPVLASKWEVSNDGKTYKFYIKKNLYWNDGELFTAKGVNYKFQDVESKVINDYEIDFKLKKPLPIFPTYLAAPIIKYPFVGVAGLYRIDNSKVQYGNITELYLSPNKNNLPIIVYKFYDNETKLVNAYKLGEINEMVVSRKSLADSFKDWKNTQIDKSIDYSRLLTLFFNMNNEILKQKDFRKGITLAIPKEDYKNEGVMAMGPIPPISWAYNPNLKAISYDPDLSEKLIKKSYESSNSATLKISTYYDYVYVAEAIKKSLEQVGIKVSINTISYSQPDSFDMLLAYWKVPLDPDQYYFWHSTQKQGNISNYNNIKIDKLLEDGRNSTSVEDRKKIYADFQKNLVDDLPAYFMFYPYIYTVKRK